MKKSLVLIIAIAILMFSCSDEPVAPTSDFTYSVLDMGFLYSDIGWHVTFTDNSVNASSQEWQVTEPFVEDSFTTGTGYSFTYEYIVPGIHEVILKTESQDGLTATKTKKVIIEGQTLMILINNASDFNENAVVYYRLYTSEEDWYNSENYVCEGNFFAIEKHFITHIPANTPFLVDCFCQFNNKNYWNENAISFMSYENDICTFAPTLVEFVK